MGAANLKLKIMRQEIQIARTKSLGPLPLASQSLLDDYNYGYCLCDGERSQKMCFLLKLSLLN